MNEFTKGIAKPVGIALGVVLVGGVLWLVFGDRIKAALGAVGNAVNPTSDQNLFYRGTNAVGAAISGDGSFSLGSAIYDWFHAEYDPNAKPKAPPDERAWYEQLLGIGG